MRMILAMISVAQTCIVAKCGTSRCWTCTRCLYWAAKTEHGSRLVYPSPPSVLHVDRQPINNRYLEKFLMSSAHTAFATSSQCKHDVAAYHIALLTNPEFMTDDERKRAEDDYALAIQLAYGSESTGAGDSSSSSSTSSDYALALMLSKPRAVLGWEVSDDTPPQRLDQIAEENSLTAKALPVPFTEVEGTFGADNSVTIDSVRYTSVDRGSSHGTHFNLCFYMSVCAGDGGRAMALKTQVAPVASSISAQISPSAPIDFGSPGTMANTEVFMAMVRVAKIPVCVANVDAGKIVLYTDVSVTQPTVYIRLAGGHFTQLVRA